MKTAVMLAALVLALVSCSGGSGGSAGGGQPPLDVSGQWNGAWTSTNSGNSGPLEVFVTQSGSALSGELTVHGSPCADEISAVMHGTVSGTHVHFQVSFPDMGISIDGEVNLDPAGDSIYGAYLMQTNGSCGGDVGTAVVERQ